MTTPRPTRPRSWGGSTARSAPSSRTPTGPLSLARRSGPPVDVRAAVAGLGTAATRTDPAARSRRPSPSAGERRRLGLAASAVAGGDPVVVGLLGLALLDRSEVPTSDDPRAGRAVRSLARRRTRRAVPDRASRGRRRALALPGRLVGGLRDRGRRRGDPVVARSGRRGRLASGALPRRAAGRGHGLGRSSSRPVALAPLALAVIVNCRAERQRRLFGDQLADHLVGGRRLSAGRSQLPRRAGGGTRRGSRAGAAGVRPRYGRRAPGPPLEDALESVAHRMRQSRGRTVALLAKLQREAGSDAAEMVDQVVTTVRERRSCAARCAR